MATAEKSSFAIRRAAARPVSAAADFARGFGYSVQGFRLAFAKGFKRWTLAPVLIGLLVYAGMAGSFLYGMDALLRKWFGGLDHWYEWAVAALVGVIAVVAFVLVFFFTFVLLVSILAAPFIDVLSEKTEALLAGEIREEPFTFKRFVADMLRGVSHAVKLLLLQLVVLLIGLIPVVGPPAAVAGTGLLLSMEYMDPAMTRRRMRFREKRRITFRRAALCAGFGLGAMLWLVVPGLNLVSVPAAVCGATAMLLHIETASVEAARV